ncbi:MAG TPA: 2-C-methyl-D-erythritol 4-phosphate cytidylyltransferase [Pontiella sp.]|nr:2-C-methyl-D-erythritol 4-phosphate cytidylyltransferase [Pontiella sp.]
MNTLAIVIACGKEEELSPGTETAFLPLGDMPMLAFALKTMQATPSIDGVILVVGKARTDAAMHLIKRYGCTKVVGIVIGGVTRLSILRSVFSKMPEPASMIVVHEASRPFVSIDVLEETIKAGKRYGCAIAAHRLSDSMKLAPKGMKAVKTLERNSVWAAQTPQAFKFEVLEKLIAGTSKNMKILDDESEFVRKPSEVHMVESGSANIKIRSAEDLAVATALINAKIA